MPLLSGSVSVTRFDLSAPPVALDLDAQGFRGITPGSEVRESIGFVPFEPGAEYQVGHDRWAFRVRIDNLKPDPTAVRERVQELVRTELEATGSPFVGPKKRRELRHLAEEELIINARPQSKIIEGALRERLLYLGTAANTQLGKILLLLRKVGVIAQFKTPWSDLGEADIESDIWQPSDPLHSIHGSRFLQALIGDRELVIEPADGYVKLQTRDATVVISGGVIREVLRHVENDAELIAAKLTAADTAFRLDALAFRMSGLRLERVRPAHWSERLEERLEQIDAVWELLDRKYRELQPKRIPRRRVGAGHASGPDVESARSHDSSASSLDNVVPFDQSSG